MNHKAHMIAGIFAGVSIAGFLSKYETREDAIVGGVACFLGSEFPDLDTGSIPSRMFARFGFLAAFGLLYYDQAYYAALVGIFFMFVKSQPHRGITHSYFLPLLLFLFSVVIFQEYAIMLSCFGVGLLVHYILDRRNPLNPLNWVPI